MIYQLFQIQLSSEDWAAINAAGNHDAIPKNKARIAMQMDFSGSKIAFMAKEAFNNDFYSHVANIDASDLEDAFEIGNIGPDSAIERLNQMSSVSVGDLIIDEDGNKSVVASFGFKEVA